MAGGRRGRGLRALALLAVVCFPLAACSALPEESAERPPPAEQPHSSSYSAKEGEDHEEHDESFTDDSTPQHDGSPPQYEPAALWPAEGQIELPENLGDYQLAAEPVVSSTIVTTIYSDSSYQLLSITIGSDYRGYNNRLENYDNLTYVGQAVCGDDSTQASTEIAWATCFMVGSDGYLAVTAYATSETDRAELSSYADDLYRALTEATGSPDDAQ